MKERNGESTPVVNASCYLNAVKDLKKMVYSNMGGGSKADRKPISDQEIDAWIEKQPSCIEKAIGIIAMVENKNALSAEDKASNPLNKKEWEIPLTNVVRLYGSNMQAASFVKRTKNVLETLQTDIPSHDTKEVYTTGLKASYGGGNRKWVDQFDSRSKGGGCCLVS